MFSIFERNSRTYDPVGYYINEYRASNQDLGTTVKGAKNNDPHIDCLYMHPGW